MKVLSDKNSLDVFLEASNILTKAVAHTLGPNGSNTAVHTDRIYSIINDGKTIVEELTSTDPVIAPALETLKQASFETNRKAGDGTTSTIVITDALLNNLNDYHLTYDINKVEIANNLLELEDILLDRLKDIKQEISPEQYEHVARVSLGSSKYSKLVADEFKFADLKATPIYIKSDQPEVTAERVDGVQLTKIKWATRMILDTLNKSEFNNMKCLVLFQPVDRFEEITQLVRKTFQDDRYTLLLYNELSLSILENLLLNLSNGTSKVIPVSLSEYGKYKSDLMSELADYTQTKVIDGAELKVSDVLQIEFGHIDNAILSQEQIIINNEACNDNKYVTFTTKSSVIRCGGHTRIDMEDNYRRIEDAVHSLDSAIKYGVVEGAGFTYKKLLDIPSLMNRFDENFLLAVYNSLSEIYNLIGIEEISEDILDSALVTEEVIKNSFTIVAQILTTNAIIHNNLR